MLSAKYYNKHNTTASSLSRQEKLIVGVSLICVVAMAWAYMVYDYWQMQTLDMADMWMPPTDGGAWTLLDFWLTFVMWSVMMAAMMVPSAAPMVLMFATINRKLRENLQSFVPTFVFLCGYIVTWTVFSALITLIQWQLHYYALLTPMMGNSSYILAGSVLIIAGIYQWTPWKDACLKYCRTPLAFVMTEWRPGIRGALQMGIKHGAYCVGCCWAMMLVLFAVGVMNMFWIVLIAFFVLFEKLIPGRPRMTRLISGTALTSLGIWVLAFLV